MTQESKQYADAITEIAELWQPALDALAEVFLIFGVKRSDLEGSKALQSAFLHAATTRYERQHGKLPSVQQAALLAGLQRKLASQLSKGSPQPEPRYTTAVLSFWLTRPPYCKDGKPLSLPLNGPGSFKSLCIRVCGELGYRNAMRELIDSGAVKVDNDYAHMVKSTLIADDPDSITTLGFVTKSVQGLAEAIAHNLSGLESKYPQKITWSDEIPANLEPSVMADIRQILDDAFARVREVVIAAETADDNPTDRHYLTVGLYAHSKPIGE
jgi:hypothetical protein